MNFTEDNKDKMAAIAAKHATNIQAAIAAAFEEGILEGAIRAARAIGNKLAAEGATQASNSAQDNDSGGPLSAADSAWLRAQGIDPTKKFRHRNAYFTITGVKQSRWKFPVTAVSVRGTSYKWPLDTVKAGQR